MTDYLRTLFLHPPSFQGFDGGAGARYQARREIRSFWYPTWLAQPAALVPGSRLVDAPPAGLTLDDVVPLGAGLRPRRAPHERGVVRARRAASPRRSSARTRDCGSASSGAHVAVAARARARRLAGDRVRRRQRVRLHDPGDRRRAGRSRRWRGSAIARTATSSARRSARRSRTWTRCRSSSTSTSATS